MTDTVVTRFAPSPTGFLHIGGARTALFNWLYARHCGGRFVLRIEDTDRERSTDASIEAIFEGLAWLGLDYDGDPVFQFQRADRHRAVVEELLAKDMAYRCYATAEELQQAREEAQAEGRVFRYDGRWRDRDPSDAPKGQAPAIRLKASRDGETVIKDHVQGDVTIQNQDLDDLVLLRSDGTPTYMLAVVVDDHDQGVTHVIRGDDHLINAARQMQIMNALGWAVPHYAHVPLIHGPDGAKLSKRHGALGVEAYRDQGYLPEAMRTYLARLGWSHGDDEIFTTEQAVDWFDLDGIRAAPARIDFEKLAHVNAHFLRAAEPDRLIGLIRPALEEKAGQPLDEALEGRVRRCLGALAERADTTVALGEQAGFLVAPRPLPIEAASAKHLTEDSRAMLSALRDSLGDLDDWSLEGIEGAVRGFADARGLKFGKVGPPLRAALTGTPNSPGLFDVIHALGREETLARIGDQAAVSLART
ncbi:MAG: glutamate--tRNA ligase [Alphaproteobacteria bacterium]